MRIVPAQYQRIREIIAENLQTIRNMVDQSKSLKELINRTAQLDPPLCMELKAQLSALRQNIYQLIKQTDELFDNYEAFVQEIIDNS